MKMMMIVLLLLISQHASGVEVYEGAESVMLPCQVPADVSRSSTAAVWDREELSDATVHLRSQKSDNLSGQNKLYKDRTSMRVDALQTGDLSLTLKNPTVSDSGTYTCITRKEGQDQNRTEVQLKVTVPALWPKVLAAVLGTLIISYLAFALCVYCAHKRMKDREALQTEMVEVPQEEGSVLLPLKTTADLREDVRVEWRLTQPNDMKVHVYESGKHQPDEQDQCYRGRTEIKEDPLRNKDLSLTLKHLRPTDSGVYTCTVYNKDGGVLLQKAVILSVRVPPPEMVNTTDADKSVQLSFKTTADLPQDVTVEWRLTEPKHMKVHVYESGNNQPNEQDQVYRGRTEMDEDPLRNKDLSLTLKDLHLTDSGVYTCTVYNKDGHKLLQKSMRLRVREGVPDFVQVRKGQESVLLPLKTTADLHEGVRVEWRLTQPSNMKVHVYESGKNQPDKQDQGDGGRTEMDGDPLRNKDLSLRLKDPRLTDTGVYTCTVYNKSGDKLLQKSVTLHVYGIGLRKMKTVYGNKSCLVEFEKPDKLPEISTVEWKLIYPKYKLIKKINNRQGNEEDLSLTLKHPRLTDSGIYTCTVYRENGDILLQQSVIFRVRDFQLEMVEVTEGEESVLLPFKTTADLHDVVKVHWTLTEDKSIVHMYENGKDKLDSPHQDYIGRTEMNKDPLRTGDLSLTLKDLHPNDSRSYTCTVYNKDGDTLLQKVVALRVRVTLMGTIEDMLPCLRRRRAPKPEVKEELRNRSHEDVPLTAEETV